MGFSAITAIGYKQNVIEFRKERKYVQLESSEKNLHNEVIILIYIFDLEVEVKEEAKVEEQQESVFKRNVLLFIGNGGFQTKQATLLLSFPGTGVCSLVCFAGKSGPDTVDWRAP